MSEIEQDPQPPESELADLATAYGIATEFWDWRGRHTTVRRSTIVAVLAALGVDASTAASVRRELAASTLARWRAMLPPCVATRRGVQVRFAIHVPHGDPVEVWVGLEDGTRREDVHQEHHLVAPQWVDDTLVGEATFRLPADLPTGYHEIRARSGELIVSAPLVVTPARLEPSPGIDGRRSWGFAVQLYGLRSRWSWGVGDLADLGELAVFSAWELGAGFVLVNPLHAAEPTVPVEPSPYLPTTRRFTNLLYLRIEDVPELAYAAPADRRRIETLARRCRALDESADLLDRDTALAAKLAALETLHAVPRPPGREAEYQAFLRREGVPLSDFATWCVLAEKYGPDWRDWPAAVRDPASPEVADVRQTCADRVDLHCYAQWLLDAQLGGAQDRARAAGMPLGVVHDLPVGVHPHGADAWALQDVLATGITVGAPPDEFNQQGQDWSQPPWRPDRLAATGYAAWRDVVARAFRHAGGVRVDHVMGMFRLWWVPEGAPATEGTYVRYDHEALVGILALEAERAGAVLVGEDLGTVEPWVREVLAERGILGTSVLWFEREDDGRPRRPETWRDLCLATVTVHDLPPTAAYLDGAHVRLRSDLGLLTRSVQEELAAHEGECEGWLAALTDRGLLRPGAGEEEIVEALHRYVGQTPARLVGVALTDAVGDRRTQNQPGTHKEYPNWQMPLCGPDGSVVLLEDLPRSARLRRLAATMATLR